MIQSSYEFVHISCKESQTQKGTKAEYEIQLHPPATHPYLSKADIMEISTSFGPSSQETLICPDTPAAQKLKTVQTFSIVCQNTGLLLIVPIAACQ